MIEVSKQTQDEMILHLGHKLSFIQDSLGYPTLICVDCSNKEKIENYYAVHIVAEFYAIY